MNQLPAKASYRADWDRLSLAELKDQDGYSYLLQWLRRTVPRLRSPVSR
jgi:hypothetical protein